MGKLRPELSRRLPLAGLRVIEFGFVIAGPLAARLLADFGAEVIKVESAAHAGAFRGTGEMAKASKAGLIALRHFNEFNRNKKSVTLNMAHPRGRELLLQLVLASDVLLDNYAPGVLTRWGFSYERLRELKPEIIVMNMPGMGNHGPWSPFVTWGPNLISVTGMTHLWGLPEYTQPVGSQSAHPDYIAAAYGAFAVVMALHHRARTGRGQHIEVAQFLGAASMLGSYYLDYLVNGRDAQPLGNRHPYYAPYNCYRCQGEDHWCVIAVTTEEQWQRFCRALGGPAWTQEPRFATMRRRVEHAVALDRLVEAWTRQRTPHEVMEILQGVSVPAAVVQNGKDLFEDAHLGARGYLAEIGHKAVALTLTYPGITVGLAETPGAVRHEAPEMGEDNTYIFGEILGLSAAEQELLRQEGVLG